MPTSLALRAQCTHEFGEPQRQQVTRILADGNLKGLYAASQPPTLNVWLHSDAEEARGRLERAAEQLRQVQGIREVKIVEQCTEVAGPQPAVMRATRQEGSHDT